MADQKISQLTNYATPLDADVVPVVDTANTVTKKTTWANFKATLKSYFDTLYAAALTSDENYVTDAQLTVIGNTSGTNTGDQTISDETISTTDITTNNASTTKHGFLKKLSNVSTEFMNGEGNWATPASGGSDTAVDSTQSVYNTFPLFFTGSGATPTNDMWEAIGTLNSATRWRGTMVNITFGATSGARQFLPGVVGSSSEFFQFNSGKNMFITFNARFSSASAQIGVGVGGADTVFYDATANDSKILFTFDGTNLKAVNGTSSETETTVTGITATNWNNYRIEVEDGVGIRYYVNNVLKATHTTNVPADAPNARFGFGGATSGNTASVANVVISLEM